MVQHAVYPPSTPARKDEAVGAESNCLVKGRCGREGLEGNGGPEREASYQFHQASDREEKTGGSEREARVQFHQTSVGAW